MFASRYGMRRLRMAAHVRPRQHNPFYGAAAPQGMGMIELVVGLGLIAVGIISMNSLAVSAIRGNVSARLLDHATRLAQQKLEQVKTAGYGAANPGTTDEGSLDYAGGSGGPFSRTTVIAAGGLPMTRIITVTMAWLDQGPRRITFTTQIQGASAPAPPHGEPEGEDDDEDDADHSGDHED